MAAGNLDSADLKAVDFGGLINEDVMQKIWDISKIPLPVQDLIGSGTSKNSYKEWTQDTLAAPDVNNAVVDGADATGNNTATGARVGNQHQISVKEVKVSTRARNSDTIGRSDELAYQVMMRQQELRRDVDATILENHASVADDGDTIPGVSGGLPAWLTTSTSRGATGADGGFSAGTVAAATDGTIRALTETLVRDIAESVWTEGGNPSVAMSVPKVIRAFSEYLFTSSARIATLTSETTQSREAATAKGSVNVFVTDFGVTLDLVANRLQQLYQTATAANLFMIDGSMLSVSYLQGYSVEPLAKVGLADNREMSVDWTLVCNTEKAHGVIADIDISAAVTA